MAHLADIATFLMSKTVMVMWSKKGAFIGSLNDWQAKGKMPPILWQHDRGQVIGVWTKLYEDDKGLFGEGKLLIDDVAKAKEA